MSFDFSTVSAPFRMQPGLRRLASNATQLTPSRLGDRALLEKVNVLRSHADQALLCAPDFDTTPALRALSAHAAAAHPDAITWDGDAHWAANHIGWSLHGDEPRGDGPAEIGACLRALPSEWRPAAMLALAFAEDFAVIDGATGCVPWLAVCLPSHWAPEDKIGRHFAQVHAPVADNQTLITASDHLARLVTGHERWERFVWTIARDPRLDQHPQRSKAPPWSTLASVEALVESAYFRTERQTFIPMPAQQQAVFTIHVETQALGIAIASPEQARALHDALASMSPAVLAYRGLSEVRDRLLRWLRLRAGDCAS